MKAGRALDAEIIVVGGGMAGIAAAASLAHAGCDVLLVEGEDELGGKARSVDVSSVILERGPTSFHGRHRAIWSLLALLGIEEEAVPLAAKTRYLVRDGALCSLEAHPLALLTTEALTWSERLAIAREPFVSRASADESVAAFFTRRFGASLTEHVVAAALSGVFAGDLSTLSMRAALPQVWAWEQRAGSVVRGALRGGDRSGRRGVYRMRGGFSQIARAAQDRLPSRCGVSVAQVELDGDEVLVSVSDGPILAARGVIIATEAPAAAHLVADRQPAIAATLEAMPYEPLTVVHWRGSDAMPRGFGMLAAPCEKLFTLGTVFTSDARGDGERLYASFIGGALQRERAALDDRALVRGITGDLEALGLTPAAVELVHVERWARAVAQPTLGHVERAAALTRAGMPIAFAGSYLGSASLGDAAASGFAAADRALARLRSARPVSTSEVLSG